MTATWSGRPSGPGAGSRVLGVEAERLAARYLVGNGYRVLDRNWRAGRRELDLVALQEDVVVFVEVKARRSGPQDPLEALNRAKLRDLRRAAAAWIRQHPRVGREFRFDVIGVRVRPGQPWELEHIPNAFFGEDC